MILVTGGTGFIGRHLLETLVARVRPCAPWCAAPRAAALLPAGVETVYGDLATGAGIAEALRGVARRDPPGRRHQSPAPRGLLHRQCTRHRKTGARHGRAAESAWSTSVRWPPSGPPPAGVPLAEDAEPHPLTHYGKSKLEAEQRGARVWRPMP